MMLAYDKAHDLAKEIQNSEEYKEFARLKEMVTADEKTKEMIKDYKKLQLEAQTCYLTNREPSEETMEKIKKLGEVLQFNQDVTEFFAAEYKFQNADR